MDLTRESRRPGGISRRAVLGGATAALAAGPLGAAGLPALARTQPLRDVAAARGMRFGTAVSGLTMQGRPGALAARECNLLVAENEFKFGSIRPDAGPPRFGPADQIMAWAKARGIPLRGHNLYWNTVEYTPAWVAQRDFGAQPAAALEKLLADHIAVMTARYPTIGSWDVINETVLPETGEWRPTVATRLLGERLMDVTYAAARAGAPHAELVYNDFMGWDPADEKHRAGVLRTLEGMRKRNVPCDALGLQSHLHVPPGERGPALTARQAVWRRFLEEVTGMGFGLLVTELDVDDREAPAAVPLRDRAVADTARAYLDVTLDQPKVRDILVWGIDSGHSWLQGFVPRPDRLAQRGSPFDARLRPTPLRDAIAAAIEAAPPRA